jgi:hypothetical protein
VSGSIEIPLTYRYACTYQPDHLRLTLLRLRRRYGLAADDRHVSGRGEILAWRAE